MASETGVIEVPQGSVVEKGRLQPGRMFLIDTAEGRIVRDDEIKDRLAAARPYRRWLDQNLVRLDDLPRRETTRRDEGLAGAAPADVRPHPRGAPAAAGPHGRRRQGGAGLDGHRHPARGAVGPQPAPLRLLQAAVRAGHQPAAGRHPRGAGHVAVRPGRARGQPVRPAAVVVPDGAPRPAGDHRRRAGPAGGHRRTRRAGRLPGRGADCAVSGGRGRRRPAPGSAGAAVGGLGGHRGRRGHPDRLGPGRRRAAGPDPVAAGRLCGPPASGGRAHPHPGGPGVGVWRRPRGAPPVPAPRLRRQRGQPLPGPRDHRRDGLRGPPRPGPVGRRRGRPPQLRQGRLRGHSQGDVQDGHLHGGLLHRRPDLRGHRAGVRAGGRVLHRHVQPPRRHRPRRDRGRGGGPPPAGVPGQSDRPGPPHHRGRRRVPVAARGRVPPVQPRDGVQAAARHPRAALRHLRRVHPAGGRPVPTAGHPAGPVPAPLRGRARRCPWTRSSRCRRSSSASPPAP